MFLMMVFRCLVVFEAYHRALQRAFLSGTESRNKLSSFDIATQPWPYSSPGKHDLTCLNPFPPSRCYGEALCEAHKGPVSMHGPKARHGPRWSAKCSWDRRAPSQPSSAGLSHPLAALHLAASRAGWRCQRRRRMKGQERTRAGLIGSGRARAPFPPHLRPLIGHGRKSSASQILHALKTHSPLSKLLPL